MKFWDNFNRMNTDPYTDTNAGLHYDLRLELDPQTHFIAVAGSVAYHSPEARTEMARFYLHHQFEILRIEGRRVLGYQFETRIGEGSPVPYLLQAGVLDIYFSPPLGEKETILIHFEYQGTITDWPAESANVITPEWAEMGMYLPWYPMQFNGAPSSLTFTLKATAPAGYAIASYGRYAIENGSWFFNWPYPTNDIVVAAGRNLETRVVESETTRVNLATTTFSEPVAIRLGEDMLWAMDRFSGWFGPIRPGDFTLIESPRTLGGGYARRGMVVLGGLDEHEYLNQREAYLRYLAHEAAHGWWWEAPTNSWEDWLNESFAEYSALMAVRERFGNEIFDRFMSRKRERSPEFVPMRDFDRTDTSTPEKLATVERMLYDKGPLLLHDLSERIGNGRFLDFCRAMLWSGVITTDHLLDLLEELEGKETRVWFEKELQV